MAGKYLPRDLRYAFSQLGSTSERIRALLALQGNPEYFSWWDDFIGDSAGTWPASANWGYPATVGTNTEVIALAGGIGGTLTLTTAGSSGDTAGQGVGLHWSGDTGFYFIARCKLDRITNAKFEIMMTDALTDDGAVATKATPTFTATDCAGFVFDTTDDGEVTFVSNGGTADGNTDAEDFDLAADTYFVVEIVGGGPTSATGDNVTGYINGKRIGSGNINGANPLSPWFYVETLEANTSTLTVDYGGCIGRRA